MSIQPSPPPGTAPATSRPAASDTYTWIAVVLAGLTALGGLYLSFAEKKFPCPLCFYQRAFALGVFGVLLVGLLLKMNTQVSLATLALPLAFAGLGVALYHVNLTTCSWRALCPWPTGTMDCPRGIFDLSTAPRQSMIAFGLLSVALLLDAFQAGRTGNGYGPVASAAVLGLVLAAASIFFNPQPKRPIPAQEYEESPPKTCLPPLPPPPTE